MKAMISKIVLFCLLPVCALAEGSVYTILNVSEITSKEWIMVDHEARVDLPTRLEVKLRVSRDVSPSDLIAKAYFFDRNKSLIHTYVKPCIVRSDKAVYGKSGFPGELVVNASFFVYFSVTPEIKKKFPDTVLIVFGDQKTVCVKAKGSANPMDFEFPEKASIIAAKKLTTGPNKALP